MRPARNSLLQQTGPNVRWNILKMYNLAGVGWNLPMFPYSLGRSCEREFALERRLQFTRQAAQRIARSLHRYRDRGMKRAARIDAGLGALVSDQNPRGAQRAKKLRACPAAGRDKLHAHKAGRANLRAIWDLVVRTARRFPESQIQNSRGQGLRDCATAKSAELLGLVIVRRRLGVASPGTHGQIHDHRHDRLRHASMRRRPAASSSAVPFQQASGAEAGRAMVEPSSPRHANTIAAFLFATRIACSLFTTYRGRIIWIATRIWTTSSNLELRAALCGGWAILANGALIPKRFEGHHGT